MVGEERVGDSCKVKPKEAQAVATTRPSFPPGCTQGPVPPVLYHYTGSGNLPPIFGKAPGQGPGDGGIGTGDFGPVFLTPTPNYLC